jgi:hypothetical protein
VPNPSVQLVDPARAAVTPLEPLVACGLEWRPVQRGPAVYVRVMAGDTVLAGTLTLPADQWSALAVRLRVPG